MNTMAVRFRSAAFAGVAAVVVGAGVLGGGAMTAPAGAARMDSTADAQASQTITVDGGSAGRVYDLTSVQSASSSRLLVDYPEPERSQILDYLFKPDYGASLQMLEVEIGSDVNSTTIAEPSVERTEGVVNCNSGYEWWLMEQAKARNPNIKLAGLPWGFPGWVGKPFSSNQVAYMKTWLQCAQQHGLTIDYIGAANQRQTNAGTIPSAFLASLRAAAREVFPNIQLEASDQGGVPPYWKFAHELLTDPVAAGAVDVLGETTICGWRTLYQTCDGPGDPTWNDAIATGKQLWDSSASTADTDAGGSLIAREENRSYIQAKVTGHQYWSAGSAVYGDTWDAGIGLLDAQWPWSGNYELGEGVWALAHTTQFTQPGWRYLDNSSGFLSGGASYVSLRSPSTGDYSLIVEAMDETAPETLSVGTTGGLSTGPVQLWSTDILHPTDAKNFRHVGTLTPHDGIVSFTVQPGYEYTLSTLTTAHKGTAAPPQNARAERLPLPYRQDFDGVAAGAAAAYFNDINGAFEAAPCQGGRVGTCYRQVINTPPIIWQRGGNMDPTTLVGDPLWSGDYTVSSDVLLEGAGTASLLGRVERVNKDSVVGYFLSVSDTGQWQLYYQNQGDDWLENWNLPANSAVNTVLASGSTSIGIGSWHNLSMRFSGSNIDASIDGNSIASVTDGHATSGQVGLRVNAWQAAEFDDLTVTPTAPAQTVLDPPGASATATSHQAGPLQYAQFAPDAVLDRAVETEWMSSFCADIADSDSVTLCAEPKVAALPQSITIDLGRPYTGVSGLVYKPPTGNTRVNQDGIVTGYRIDVSTDGVHFSPVANGNWSLDIGSKTVTWTPTSLPVRYVRLTATAADGGVAGASEIQLLQTSDQ